MSCGWRCVIPAWLRDWSLSLVPEAGIEPARHFWRGILSPLRLPISPLRQQGKPSRKLWHSDEYMDLQTYPTLEDAIGKTPLVALQRIGAQDNQKRGNVLLGKLEGNNPAGSVKDRPALSMIRVVRDG